LESTQNADQKKGPGQIRTEAEVKRSELATAFGSCPAGWYYLEQLNYNRMFDDWIVTGGLKPGEKVITDAGPQVRPGIPVKPEIQHGR